ncbi:MAG: hypothetical protein IKC31_02330 [Clostridia bacterium]|nr:hypothetical protein [Clostridia bacterium]
MKKYVFRFFVLLTGLVLLLSGCSKLHTVTYKDGQYLDKTTEIVYRPASLCYEAVSIKEGGIAKIKDGLSQVLYEINGVDPSLMLANEEYEIFYAVGTTLPTLTEMNPVGIAICKTQSISAQLAAITDAAELQEILDAYVGGTGCSDRHVNKAGAVEQYYLKFYSTAYPTLYYCLEYLRFASDVEISERVEDEENFVPKYTGATYHFEDYTYTDKDGNECTERTVVYNFGNGILYDRMAGICYAVGSDVIESYIESK